jgi:hypothetical protein
MRIKFTKHALERMRVRNISKEEVIYTLNNPDKELNDSFGNKIAHKLKENYLLRVFYNVERKSKIIITAYKTSKIDKYF